MILAGGFTIDAATNNIEVSRVMIEENKPTRIVVANLEMDRSFEVLSSGVADGDYPLQAYDNVAVRFLKNYELQERVFLSGEFNVPGPYALPKPNTRVSEMIQRAEGLTEEAFPEGASLIRNANDLGPIVIKLDEVIRNPESEYNFILRDGDEIKVPKIREFVSISGAIRTSDAQLNAVIGDNNLIRVPFVKGKDALYYINEFGGGLDENADKKKVFVSYANGEVKYSKVGLFKRNYPDIKKGSSIYVGYKDPEVAKEKKASDTDWSNVFADSIAQAVSILTLILLIQRVE